MFDNVHGLKDGAVVRLDRLEVGTVGTVEFVGADIRVTMELPEKMQSHITTQSRSSLGSVSLLGDVTSRSALWRGEPPADGAFIPSTATTQVSVYLSDVNLF